MESTLSIKSLKAVRRLLYPVRRKWYDIGIELEIGVEELDNIKTTNKDDPRVCLIEMIKVWLKSIDPHPTWKALCEALKSDPVGEEKLAEKGILGGT